MKCMDPTVLLGGWADHDRRSNVYVGNIKAMTKSRSANGTTGILIRISNGTYCFRVYNKDHTFTDYDLLHNDLCITIKDKDAFFYRDANGNSLDHSPATLGIKK